MEPVVLVCLICVPVCGHRGGVFVGVGSPLAATVLHFLSFKLAKCDLCPSVPDQQDAGFRKPIVSYPLDLPPDSAAAAVLWCPARPRSRVTGSRSVDAVSPVLLEKVKGQTEQPTVRLLQR